MREGQHLKWLVVAFAIVAMAFLASAFATQRSVSSIDDELSDLKVNSLPSVTHLSNARAELQRSRLRADEITLTPSPGDGRGEAGAALLRSQLVAFENELAEYERTPWYPNERQIFDIRLRPSITRLSEAADALERTGPGSAGRAAADLRYDTAASDADEVLSELLDLNHAQAYAAVERILDARRGYDRLSTMLTLAAAAIALLAGVLAFRLSRRADRAAHAEVEHQTKRAAELETFAQRVGHDLINPMSTVMLSLGLIGRTHEDAQTRRAIDRASRALVSSRAMVQGIFEFARAGARPAGSARASLREGVRVAVDELAQVGSESAPEVQVEPLEDLDLACDPRVFAVILRNILGNAVKYTKDSPVRRISVRAQAVGSAVRVEVQDTGPGLPPGLDEAIFEPYVRAASATQPGLGLGLATVKGLVKAHGGEAGARRPEEGGAAFWFELPIARRRVEDAAGAGENVDVGDRAHASS